MGASVEGRDAMVASGMEQGTVASGMEQGMVQSYQRFEELLARQLPE